MPTDSNRTKGCFQCSKRRIVCDKAEPVCFKCEKKGIECSGSGRIRFSKGIAQRGRLKGHTVPVPDPPQHAKDNQITPVTPQRIRWKSDQLPRSRRRDTKAATRRKAENTSQSLASPSSEDNDQLGHTEPTHDINISNKICALSPLVTNRCSGESQVIQALGEDLGDDGLSTMPLLSVTPWIPPLKPQARMLMAHFSEQVAPVMVFLDTVSNGYRDILLPLACEDDLVQRAVGVVATQHMAYKQPHLRIQAEQGRSAIISRLVSDCSNSSPEKVFNLSTWATLIILLVGETVTGSSEYGYLLQMLICLTQNVPDSSSTAQTFLKKQTHMFQFLGQPLTGENKGVHALGSPLEHYLDFLNYDLPSESPHNHAIHISRAAFIKASQIYLGRTASANDQWNELESLKQLVQQIDPDQEGSHVLVWVCFIGAADSTDPEHRRFFVERMERIFSKTRFTNIMAGVKYLPAIWSQQGSTRWTQTLAEVAPALIM